MKIYILSNNGFIGSSIQNYFAQSAEVIGFSSKECNLIDSEKMNLKLSNITKEDVLIITASITRLVENSYSSMINNIRMIDNLCSFLVNHQIKHLFFLSSIDVYGIENKYKIDEKQIPNPNDYYSISKITSEHLLQKYSNEMGCNLSILRLTGIYGIGDEGKSTINKLFNSARKNKIIIYGDGTNKRDYVFVNDLANIIQKLIDCKHNGILNVATGKSLSIIEIANLLKKDYFPECEIVFKLDNSQEKRIKHLEFDTLLLKKVLPSLEFTPFNNGIKKYVESYSIKI